MDNIIGIGQFGTNIAEKFKQYGIYNIYHIDAAVEESEGVYSAKICGSHEEYAKTSHLGLKDFLGEITGETLLITSSGKISGMTGAVLQHLQTQQVSILYVKPDLSLGNDLQRLQHRATMGPLQEWARSGALKHFSIVSNEAVQNILPQTSIIYKNDKINEYLASTIHMLNVFKNTEAAYGGKMVPKTASRISTFASHHFSEEVEFSLPFHPLETESERHFYFAINENNIEQDKNLEQKINNFVSQVDTRADIKYSIHSTKYDSDYCFEIIYTNTPENP